MNNSMILLDQASRIAAQIGAKIICDKDRARVMIGNLCLGSTLIDERDGMILLSRHAVANITGVQPA